MKHIIILGDGMADHAVDRLGGKTLLEYANTPNMDYLARIGRTGRLLTVPDGFLPGSEVANTTILGYDMNRVYEGRGPLEAASIGYDMQPDDLALRCNIICLADQKIKNHHGGHLTTDESQELIDLLNEKLGNDRVKFIKGIQYRGLLVKPEKGYEHEALQTATLLNELIIKSQEVLYNAPLNVRRRSEGKDQANSIWPWGGGYRPQMKTLSEMYPQIKHGDVISAVDLIRGIGHYAGLRNIIVPGATGLANTDYEGKTQAALDALRKDDFVFLHVEASDEAGHDGDLELKLRTIENLDKRMVGPIFEEVSKWDEPVCIAVMPDHPTPVEIRTHVKEPVPFLVWYPGIEPDSVETYNEVSCVSGSYGMLHLTEFMDMFMGIDVPAV